MFRRPLFILTAVAIVSRWAAAFAVELPGPIPREPGTEHIEVAELTPLGSPIVAKIDLNEGERIVWKADAGSTLIKADNSRAYIWATPGGHVVEAVLIPAADGDPHWLRAEYAVGDAPPPSPVKTLAELAADKAPALAAFYVEFRGLLPMLSSSETLRTTHEQGLKLRGLDETGAKREIARRFDKVVPLEATTLTDELRSSIDAMLAAFATELGGKPPTPPTPPVPPGPTPDDPWKVGEAVAGVCSALSASVKAQAPATAALFDEAAAGLESAKFATINQAAGWLQAERKKLWGSNAAEWSAVEGTLSEIWSQHWPMLKGDVINFYRAVAAGLRSVTNG